MTICAVIGCEMSRVVYGRNLYFGLGPIPNWPIILADTVTDTETTFQMKNVETKRQGTFFNHRYF